MPFMSLAEVENTLYAREDPYANHPNMTSPIFHEVGVHRPLDLLKRFKNEVQAFEDQRYVIHNFPDAPLPSEDMIQRRWEQIFFSRLPSIEEILAELEGGEPGAEYAERDVIRDHMFETIFIEDLVGSLKLVGKDEDHPARGIRMPRILAENKDWQEFAILHAWYFAKTDDTHRRWMSFLVTRPFAVFEVICDSERRRRGHTKEMVAQSWRDNGYWIGNRWPEESHRPGWTWPCEDPSYFLDDFIGTWDLADELWLGDPKQRPDHPSYQESREAEPVTEKELAKDPNLSRRQQDWVLVRQRDEEEIARARRDSDYRINFSRRYCEPPSRDSPCFKKNIPIDIKLYEIQDDGQKRGKKRPAGDADAPAPKRHRATSPCYEPEIVVQQPQVEADPKTRVKKGAYAEALQPRVVKEKPLKKKPLEATRRSSRLARRSAGPGLA
jgi:hypothetical protein